MPPKLNLTGLRFGWLSVEEEMESKDNRSQWLCQCGCGNKVILFGSRLVSGNTVSCGCKRKNHNRGFLVGKRKAS